MSQVTADNLKSDVDAILQRVQRDGEHFEVMQDDHVVARLIPAGVHPPHNGSRSSQDGSRMEPRPLSPDEREQLDAMWTTRDELQRRTPAERAAWIAELDALAKQIDDHISDDVSLIDGVSDLRRDL
ncbi:MAG TPA: hypothetical protein VGW38_10065 [Chloroflexota bacterium]|nr:hypothetical protein [Chloroflexota bacterium]